MKVFSRLLSVLLLLVCAAPAAEKGAVFVVPLKGEVSPSQFYFLRRALKEAERAEASAIVIEMDTLGGRVDAAEDSMDALLKVKTPTYTYINSRALSAGSFIALATGRIYMAPNGVIGAAAPVTSNGEDLQQTMREKAVSALSAIVRAAAQKTGHNPALADAFIRKESEFKVGDVVMDGPNSLLTLSAEEATRKIDNKPVLAEGIAGSLEEMLKMANLSAGVQRVEPTGFERIAGFLTGIAPLLLLGGIVGAYIEMKTPGFGLPGIVSTICFTLFFTGSYLAGLAGWEVMIIFFLGLGLIISELFVHPGTILPGLAGFILMIGSILWAMIDRYPGQPLLPSTDMLLHPLRTLLLASVLAGVAIYFIAKLLPQTPFYRAFVLAASVPSGPALPAGQLQTGLTAGMSGISRTMLRPSGKADIAGQLVDVVSQGDLIPAGTALRVLAVEGPRVVVVAA